MVDIGCLYHLHLIFLRQGLSMNVELDDLARLAREQEPKLSVSNSSTTGLQAYTPMLSFIYGGYEFKP